MSWVWKMSKRIKMGETICSECGGTVDVTYQVDIDGFTDEEVSYYLEKCSLDDIPDDQRHQVTLSRKRSDCQCGNKF